MAKKKPETDAGRVFADETKGLNRALSAPASARKAAATRRANGAARDAEFRRLIFVVTNGDLRRGWYGPVMTLLTVDPHPDMTDLTKDFTLDDVIADVVELFYCPLGSDPTASDDAEFGFGGEDTAVWRDGRLLAVVRSGPDGKPIVSRFDD